MRGSLEARGVRARHLHSRGPRALGAILVVRTRRLHRRRVPHGRRHTAFLRASSELASLSRKVINELRTLGEVLGREGHARLALEHGLDDLCPVQNRATCLSFFISALVLCDGSREHAAGGRGGRGRGRASWSATQKKATKIASALYSLVRRRATAPATAPYDAERAAPPRLPAPPIVARILRAAALLLGTGVLTRGALRLLGA